MGMSFRRKLHTAISVSATFLCLSILCMATGAPSASAQDSQPVIAQDGPVASTDMMVVENNPSQSEELPESDQSELSKDEQNSTDDTMTLALWNSPPAEGWLKFFNHNSEEFTHKEITVSGQLSYTMPTLNDVPSVEYHANQGLSGNADWVPIAWQSQWFDVGGRCRQDHDLSECQITGNGGFTPITVQGSQEMRRFRPGDRVAHPTATGSNPKWMIYHKSWVVYAGQIRYAPNGGSGTMQSTSPNSSVDLNNETHFYNLLATLAANKFTRPGYRFTGWKSRGTSVVQQPGDTVYMAALRYIFASQDSIYDAQWERLPQVTSMPSTGGTGLVAMHLAGAGLCAGACGGVSSLVRRRDEHRK